MKGKYLTAAGAVLLVALAILLVIMLRKPPPPVPEPAANAPAAAEAPPGTPGTPAHKTSTSKDPRSVDITKPSEHGAGIDRKLGQLLAMMKAEGKTPCETAYNATIAEQKAAKELGRKSIFVHVAERGEFMRICEGLPKEAQACMAPSYLAKNRQQCLPYKPPEAVLRSMFEVRPEKEVEPDEPQSASSTNTAPKANMQ
jgi:hypothetical protein